MTTPKRKRDVQLNFRVSPEELAMIEQKMAQLGTKNREAYLRKMALDGYVVRLELPAAACMRPGAFMTPTWKIYPSSRRLCGMGCIGY